MGQEKEQLKLMSPAHHKHKMGLYSINTYSPLERYLIFQSLAIHDSRTEAFAAISNLLKNTTLLPDVVRHDSDRLDPDAVSSVCLGILNDAIQRTSVNRDRDVSGEGIAAASETQQTPTLAVLNIEDIAKYSHLVPQLAAALFNAYRDQVVRELRDDEFTYDALTDELKQLEEQPSISDSQPSQKSNNEPTAKPSPIEGGEQPPLYTGLNVITTEDTSQPSLAESSSPSSTFGQPSSASRQTSKASIDALINHDPPGVALDVLPRTGDLASRVAENNITYSDEPVAAPLPIALDNSLLIVDRAQKDSMPTYSYPPYAPASSQRHATASLTQTCEIPLTPSPASSTVILPVPEAMPQQPNFSVGQWNQSTAISDLHRRSLPAPTFLHQYSNPNQHYRSPQLHSRDNDRQMVAPSVALRISGSDFQSQHTVQYSMQSPSYRPYQTAPSPVFSTDEPFTGAVLPPYRPRPRSAFQQTEQMGPFAAPRVSRTQSMTNASGGIHVALGAEHPSYQTPITPRAIASFSRTLQLQHSRKQGVVFSPGAITGWKMSESLQSVRHEIESPQFERISSEDWQDAMPTPDLDRPVFKNIQEKVQPDLAAGIIPDLYQRESKGTTSILPPKGSSPTVYSSDHAMKAHSIASNAGKPFTSAVSQQKSPADELSSPTTVTAFYDDLEKSPSTVRLPPSDSSELSNKRKRVEQTREDSVPPIVPSSIRVSPTVIAFRNFNRMTHALVNNIEMHKHASLFANPVRERDAPGYKNIIRRPQDLSSIKKALLAGNRAVAGARATEISQASPNSVSTAVGGNASGALVLPFSADLVPPKAIVNGAQLEREIMRMFANAIMFNPGNKGVVKDTRQMFDAVEQHISEWRAAESTQRVIGEDWGGRRIDDDKDELALDEDVSISALGGKKRRM